MAKKIKADSSKSISPDFHSAFYSFDNAKRQLVQPPTNLETYTDLLKDTDVASAVKVVVDSIMFSGYGVTYKKEDKKNENAFRKLLKKYRFDIILRKTITNTLIYRKAYIELVRKPMSINGDAGNVVVELHVLHTPSIVPIISEHGDVLGYLQQVGDKPIKFRPDEISEIDIYPATNSYWGFRDLDGLVELVKTKQLLEAYVDYVYRNNRIVDFWKFADNVPKDKVVEFVNNLKQASKNPNGHLVISGNIERHLWQNHAFLKDILEYLYYLRGKIYDFFGVPPIYAGFIEGANRSSADTQTRIIFNNKVKAIKAALEDQINNDLFEKIGLRARFKFNPYDRLELKDRMQMALQLKALGVTNKVVSYFLKNGYLPEEISFSRVTDNSKKINDQTTNITSPSRQPKDIDNKKITTGYESTTRDDQIFGK